MSYLLSYILLNPLAEQWHEGRINWTSSVMERVEVGGWFSGGARDYSGLKISNKVKEGERMFLSRIAMIAILWT